MPLDSTQTDSAPVVVGMFNGNAMTTAGRRQEITWAELSAKLSKHEIGRKDGAYIVLADLPGNELGQASRAKGHDPITRTVVGMDIEQIKEKRDAAGAIVSPAGPAVPPIDEIVRRIEAVGCDAVVYTTHSHTDPENPRLRIMLRLETPLPPAVPIVEIVAEHLGLTECLDRSKLGAKSVLYLPRVTEERKELAQSRVITTGKPLAAQIVGRAMKRHRTRQAQQAEDAREREAKREQRKRDLQERGIDPNSLPIVKAKAKLVLDEIDLAKVLKDHDYDQDPESKKWRHPESASGIYGLEIRTGDDGEERVISYNGTDPLNLYAENPAAPKALDIIEVLAVLKHGNNKSAAIASILAPKSKDVVGFSDVTALATTQAGAATGRLHLAGEHPYGIKSWLVYQVLPRTGHGLLAGQWGVGKTFGGFDLAGAVMFGDSFAGYEVDRRCGVLWLAAEAESEVPERLRAVCDAYGRREEEAPFVWCANFPSLLEAGAVKAIAAIAAEAAVNVAGRGAELGLIILDTLGAGAGWGDENDTAEAQQVMNALRDIHRATGALVIAIDHYGKNVGAGTRGASSKEAGADFVLAFLGERQDNGDVKNRRMALRKVRGGPSGAVHAFDLHRVKVGVDDKGRDITTCVILWRPDKATVSPEKLAHLQWLDALLTAVEEAGEPKVSLDAWMAAAEADVRVDTKTRSAMRGAKKRLVEAGLIGAEGEGDKGLVWPIIPGVTDQ
jgi:hypothetical protein